MTKLSEYGVEVNPAFFEEISQEVLALPAVETFSTISLEITRELVIAASTSVGSALAFLLTVRATSCAVVQLVLIHLVTYVGCFRPYVGCFRLHLRGYVGWGGFDFQIKKVCR